MAWAWPAAGLAGLLLVWQAGVDGMARDNALIASFGVAPALRALLALLQNSELWTHVALSLRRVGLGLLAALALGVPLGLAAGLSPRFARATTPLFQFLRMVSPLSWMPLAVMALGVGDAPVVFLLAFAAVWPLVLNTAAGVAALDPQWLQLARSLSATRLELLAQVVLPGIAAHVLAGVRLAIGVLWIVLVPAEMLGVSAGLGYLILDARDRLAYSDLMALILLIGALGWALDHAARWLHARAG
ncbi:ABC transporter permease [Pelomonas sp. CA6]|uniref:ABC transporter permease n=1 Tax=Pelomonas sp. CA6 TaxID=2907999 RepID=UPI0035A8E6BD